MSDIVTALIDRLVLMADQGDYGRKPDPTDVRRRAAVALSEQTTRIAKLEEALELLVGEELDGDARPPRYETEYYRPVITWADRAKARAALKGTPHVG